MDLRVLRYFLAVVREESITGAAEALHLTQPTLSRQLMDLEEELGAQLFIRGSRNQKIALTEKGLLLRRRADELVELAEKTQIEMSGNDETISGEISIGGGETDVMRFVARTVKDLQQSHPQIRYHLYSGNAEDVKERLDKGLLDFGVFIEPTDVQKYEYMRLPATDTWGLLMRRDHPLAACETIIPEDLLKVPLLVSRQRLTNNTFSGWLGADFDRLNIVATYNLVYNASIMVDEGVGCALTLDKLVNTTGNCSLCFIPLEPKLEAHLNIAWKKYQTFTKASELFLKRIRTACAE